MNNLNIEQSFKIGRTTYEEKKKKHRIIDIQYQMVINEIIGFCNKKREKGIKNVMNICISYMY